MKKRHEIGIFVSALALAGALAFSESADAYAFPDAFNDLKIIYLDNFITENTKNIQKIINKS